SGRVFWVNAPYGSVIRGQSQCEVFVGAIRILLKDVITVFVFSRISHVVALIIFGRRHGDDFGDRDTVRIKSNTLRALTVVSPVSDCDNREDHQRGDLNDIDSNVNGGRTSHAAISDVADGERK